MDVTKQFHVKAYSSDEHTYFDLIHSFPCLELTPTPVSGDALLHLEMVDFGPFVISKRKNSVFTIEHIVFNRNTVAIQFPAADDDALTRYQALPGAEQHCAFQLAGARVQWLIPENLWMYQIQIDQRWMEKALGQQAFRDYHELCRASSRKAYDVGVLAVVSEQLETMVNMGFQAQRNGQTFHESQLITMVSDIVMPCIMSDMSDMKISTRHKILSKALSYVQDHHGQAIRLEDLARFASTSVRNLQIVFKQEIGVSPTRYIQQYRLHRFRHALTRANSVSEAAYQSGFKHLGRLTEMYAKVFSKTPSAHLQTLPTQALEIGSSL